MMTIGHPPGSAKSSKTITRWVDHHLSATIGFLRENTALIATLSGVALAAYGFELFSLHLTIDEEVHSFASRSNDWIQQGRWGMYLLNKYMLPQPVIPFVPLFIALAFQLLAIVVLLESWDVKDSFAKVSGGVVAMAYPGMAHMHAFSTLNFGIGIGWFLVALSVLAYARSTGHARLIAVIPATLAMSIYQGLAIALVVAFIVHLVTHTLCSERGRVDLAGMGMIAVIGLLATLLYFVGQLMALAVSGLHVEYIGRFFDLEYLRRHPASVINTLRLRILDTYGGSPRHFGTSVGMLFVVIVLSLASLGVRLFQCKLGLWSKLVVAILVAGVLLSPFALGLLMRGAIPWRALVAMPVALAGLVAIGAAGRSGVFGTVLGLVVGLFVLQSVISTNSLFSSSALALEADRLTAARLLERIENAKADSGTNQVKYLEVVGYPDIESTRLRPKTEAIGASFFEWDQGDVWRILFFINTLAQHDWEVLPPEDRRSLVDSTNMMPSWPARGSVRVFGETSVIKFGPYSDYQLRRIANPQ
jgi:hypothetical protein